MVDDVSREELQENEKGLEDKRIPDSFATSAVVRALVKGGDGVLQSSATMLKVLLQTNAWGTDT